MGIAELESESVAEDDVAALAAATESLLLEVSKRLGISSELSRKNVFNVAKYFLRDINRIRDRQDGSISAIKFAGYWGFWIRKLKPLSRAFKFGDSRDDYKKEIVEVNELVALEISVAFIVRIGSLVEHKVVIDPIRGNCGCRNTGACDGAECAKQAAISFMKFNNYLNLRYIVYSMRHRTFGPHHLVTNLDHIVFGACRARGGI